MERMVEVEPDTDYQQPQHFLSHLPWDHQAVMRQAASEADRLLGGHPDRSLLIDESGFARRARTRPAWRASGAAGWASWKTAKWASSLPCAAASGTSRSTAGCICRRSGSRTPSAASAPVSRRRRSWPARRPSMPWPWCSRPASTACASPGWDWMAGCRQGTVAVAGFARRRRETFAADIHKNQIIYPTDPRAARPGPRRRGAGGPHGCKRKPLVSGSISGWHNSPSKPHGQRMAFARQHPWQADCGSVEPARLAVGRRGNHHAVLAPHCPPRDQGADEIKFTLSNAAADTPLERLAVMQGRRFWVVRSFQDGKSNCGMVDYQVRRWSGWHHHMAMVIIAMLFMAEERTAQHATEPLLSCADIGDSAQALRTVGRLLVGLIADGAPRSLDALVLIGSIGLVLADTRRPGPPLCVRARLPEGTAACFPSCAPRC